MEIAPSSSVYFFQKNEIDLEALLLMTETDYAEIGLPKVGKLAVQENWSLLRLYYYIGWVYCRSYISGFVLNTKGRLH